MGTVGPLSGPAASSGRISHVCSKSFAKLRAGGVPLMPWSVIMPRCLPPSPWFTPAGHPVVAYHEGHPGQNLRKAGSPSSAGCWMPMSVGFTERERAYHQHAPFVQDDQFWGHWAHTRQDTHGRVYDLSPTDHRGRCVRAPARRPSTGHPVGLIHAGTCTYGVAHATLSPEARVSTGCCQRRKYPQIRIDSLRIHHGEG